MSQHAVCRQAANWPLMLATTVEFLLPLFSFFARLYQPERAHSIVHEPATVHLELRHQHSVSRDARILFSDVPPRLQPVTEEDQTTYTIATRTISTFRPPSFHAYDDARRRSLRHGQSTDLAWWEDEIISPDIEQRDTLLELAKMSNNAYIPRDDATWYELGQSWDHHHPFGWEPDSDGFRGYVFATPDNATVVFSIKGTSAGVLGSGGGPTGKKDKLNDNVLFSCCCARIDWTWTSVCGCHRGGWKCDQTCLSETLSDESMFYSVGINLYNNLTYMYPTANIWITGHSLGGALASLLGITFGVPVVAFESPGEKLASERLHLPSPPSTHHVTHVYHTADPIAMGTCNGILSSCALGGYAMETKCHLGKSVVYDTVTDLSWSVDIRNHGIVKVIENILDKPWKASSDVGREVPIPRRESGCVECFSWDFGDYPKK